MTPIDVAVTDAVLDRARRDPTYARALARVLGAAVSPDVDVYGSRAPYHPPPRRTHRWLARHAREIPGAVRIGGLRGRGVVWTVTRVAYETWLLARTTTTTTKSTTTSDDDRIDRWITSAGYRTTRRLQIVRGGSPR